MGVVRNLCETLWKLLRIGIPVAHAAKPAGIHVKHFQAEVRRIADHGFGDLLVDLHPAAPTVIHQEREIGILPSRRVTQDLAHPAPQNISSGVQPAVSRAKKNGWSFENLSRGHASAKRTGIRIQSDCSLQLPLVAFQSRLHASAKLDANIPAVSRATSLLYQEPWNDFPRFVRLGMGVGTRCANPFVAGGDWFHVSSDKRGFARPFFYKRVFKRLRRWTIPTELEAALQRQPYFSRIEIVDSECVLDRTESRARLPFPSEPQMRRLVFVNECHSMGIMLGCLRNEAPVQRKPTSCYFYAIDQRFGSRVDELMLAVTERYNSRRTFPRRKFKDRIRGSERGADLVCRSQNCYEYENCVEDDTTKHQHSYKRLPIRYRNCFRHAAVRICRVNPMRDRRPRIQLPLRFVILAIFSTLLKPSVSAQPNTSADADLNKIVAYIHGAWDSLTRSTTSCTGITDPKLSAPPVLYLPADFKDPAELRTMREQCHVDVEQLPVVANHTDASHLESIHPAGLLYLPNKYVVPGGRFNEMYGWDSYFIIRGLLRDGRVE